MPVGHPYPDTVVEQPAGAKSVPVAAIAYEIIPIGKAEPLDGKTLRAMPPPPPRVEVRDPPLSYAEVAGASPGDAAEMPVQHVDTTRAPYQSP